MSGECYPEKSKHMEFDSFTKENKESEERSKENENIYDLRDYETVITSAENKCSQLKGQLERIKQFYNTQNETMKTPRTTEGALVKRGTAPSDSFTGPFDNKNNSAVKKIRQNSQAIATDRTGSALETINSILAGITKPISLTNSCRKQDSKCHVIRSKTHTEKCCHDQQHGIEKIKIYSKSKQSIHVKSKSKFYPRKSKSKVATIASFTNLKKNKKLTAKTQLDKRSNKTSDTQMNKPPVSVMNQRSRKILLKSRFTPEEPLTKISTPKGAHSIQNGDLVEIYHNSAVKETKSSDSDMTKKKCPKEQKSQIGNIIPPLAINERETKFREPQGIVSCIYKNYTMPTISSRMKQVAKYYMHSFNIKSIPFCLSTSTSPSHNIGINIQQVMSMLKSKQQASKLSPTLAYNIGLAAVKQPNEQFPYVITSATSKSFNSQCPLLKNPMNYQQLQEMAKNVPQETIEEVEENEEAVSPDTQSMIITGPAGDVRVQNRKQTVWTAASEDKKCTCLTPKGISFQQIVNKFNGTVIAKNKQSTNSSAVVPVRSKEQKQDRRYSGECIKPTNKESTPLQNKEKKLKEVLGKLHDEFEKMTKTYDELVKKTEDGTSSATTIQELETLDQELNSKEEEIVMVMSLYKEVLALKNQVKELKERSSKDSISFKSQPSKMNGCNVVTTGLLNTLLQRVQHFQTHYKRH